MQQQGRHTFVQSLAGGLLWYNAGTWLGVSEADHKQLDHAIVAQTAVTTGIKGYRDGTYTSKAQYARARPFPQAKDVLRTKRLKYLRRFFLQGPSGAQAVVAASSSAKSIKHLWQDDLKWLRRWCETAPLGSLCEVASFAAAHKAAWHRLLQQALDKAAVEHQQFLIWKECVPTPCLPVVTDRWVCTTCQKPMRSAKALSTHKRHAHGLSRPERSYLPLGPVCPACGVNFQEKSRLANHWITSSKKCFLEVEAFFQACGEQDLEALNQAETARMTQTTAQGLRRNQAVVAAVRVIGPTLGGRLRALGAEAAEAES